MLKWKGTHFDCIEWPPWQVWPTCLSFQSALWLRDVLVRKERGGRAGLRWVFGLKPSQISPQSKSSSLWSVTSRSVKRIGLLKSLNLRNAIYTILNNQGCMLLTPGAACWHLHKQSKQIVGVVPHFKSKSMATGKREGNRTQCVLLLCV